MRSSSAGSGAQARVAGRKRSLPPKQCSTERYFGNGPVGVSKHMTRAKLEALFDRPVDAAAKTLGVSSTIIKRLCRRNGIPKWPYRQLLSLDGQLKRLRAELIAPADPDLPLSEGGAAARKADTKARIQALEADRELIVAGGDPATGAPAYVPPITAADAAVCVSGAEDGESGSRAAVDAQQQHYKVLPQTRPRRAAAAAGSTHYAVISCDDDDEEDEDADWTEKQAQPLPQQQHKKVKAEPRSQRQVQQQQQTRQLRCTAVRGQQEQGLPLPLPAASHIQAPAETASTVAPSVAPARIFDVSMHDTVGGGVLVCL